MQLFYYRLSPRKPDILTINPHRGTNLLQAGGETHVETGASVVPVRAAWRLSRQRIVE